MNRGITPTEAFRQRQAPEREFSMRFTSTPRGARLARRLVARRLDDWGYPRGSDPHDAVTLIVAEMASNAVRHGHVPGRDFDVRLTVTTTPGTLRIEVADSRTERGSVPEAPGTPPPADEESGRGLYLISLLADRWGIVPRVDAPGKHVWAELALGQREKG
ncbi:ATP-binding protein [Streptomyces sp. NPDC004609]|uniref:ATP-binding protein n=1 Tax=Streptomyces sp. NPDC004609 TaxID=3364704 RepID=UPI0036CA4318